MKAILCITLCLFALSFALNFEKLGSSKHNTEFFKFIRTFNKTYPRQEFVNRFSIFQQNLKFAAQHQAANPQAQFGVTQFMDLTPEEFGQQYLNFRPKANAVRPPFKTEFKQTVNAPDPTNYDWSQAGVITPVYNQGQCGSCWAFSATETIESYWALAGNQLTQLSMEQIVDCDTTDSGCNGGEPTTAYQYVESAGGLDSYSSYPYTAGGGQSGTCQFSSSNVVATISGYTPINGETGMYQQLSSGSGGPISVCVDASSWQYYQGGILTSCGNQVDHCVQTTGYYNYGASNQYWNVRNSWATSWGINGYIWIAIGQDLCSIGDYATVVTI